MSANANASTPAGRGTLPKALLRIARYKSFGEGYQYVHNLSTSRAHNFEISIINLLVCLSGSRVSQRARVQPAPRSELSNVVKVSIIDEDPRSTIAS